MKVLWLCNIMLPVIAQQFGEESSNKEGWLSGLADMMLAGQAENDVSLCVAFPAPDRLFEGGEDVLERELSVNGAKLVCFAFRENVTTPHVYDERLESYLREIISRAKPDLIHCFGTEYPHTLATCRAVSDKGKLLITIQGLCSVYEKAYEADLPKKIVHRVTFRDFVKQDSILQQKKKFYLRGENEIKALQLAGNIGGRTAWDLHYAKKWHEGARYFEMRETLRSNFYEGSWELEKCERHSIFLSQGDYPIKGLHYMLLAMPEILKAVPDARVYVAGNSIVAHKTLKDKIKLSSYGKYLRQLMAQYGLEDKITFLGKLGSEEMKERYLKSHLFVCPSAIENSPNSLGEAMLLGVPCVTADVGGIPSIFTGDEDGILYEGCHVRENDFDLPYFEGREEMESGRLLRISQNLAQAVLEAWRDEERMKQRCENARRHALHSHDRQENYQRTLEVYQAIAQNGGSREGT